MRRQVLPTAPSPTVTHLMNFDVDVDVVAVTVVVLELALLAIFNHSFNNSSFLISLSLSFLAKENSCERKVSAYVYFSLFVSKIGKILWVFF